MQERLELYVKKVQALELMMKKGFQSSTIVQVLEDKHATLYLLDNPDLLEVEVLGIAQME